MAVAELLVDYAHSAIHHMLQQQPAAYCPNKMCFKEQVSHVPMHGFMAAFHAVLAWVVLSTSKLLSSYIGSSGIRSISETGTVLRQRRCEGGESREHTA
jgi:hypothetical protein